MGYSAIRESESFSASQIRRRLYKRKFHCSVEDFLLLVLALRQILYTQFNILFI
jgi:hypothetical protein